MVEKLTKYVLRNTTNNDVMIGDLGYRIPARQSRDLLGKNARLNYDLVMKSRGSGSIAKRIAGGILVEVTDIVPPAPPPRKQEAEPIKNGEAIIFPQRTKSYITINVSDIDEESQEAVINEEEELLKALNTNEDGEAPIISNKESIENVKSKKAKKIKAKKEM